MKIYPAKDVIPLRIPIKDTIENLKKDEAINFPNARRNSILSVITRLHKNSDRKYRTVKISVEEFAVIRTY